MASVGRQLCSGSALALAAACVSSQKTRSPDCSIHHFVNQRRFSSFSRCDGAHTSSFVGTTPHISIPPSIQRYHEVRLAESSELYMHNSIILIPNLISPSECQQLMDAVERRIEKGSQQGRVYHADDLPQRFWKSLQRLLGAVDVQECAEVEPLERLPVQYLGPEIKQLSKTILEDRLLAFLEAELPEVAEKLFGRQANLAELTPSFSNNEPAVNRYVKGGEFTPHKDGYALTVNVLLSEPGAFTGGGTSLWQQSSFPPLGRLDRYLGREFVLHPHQGMGVVFNGKLSHAGRVTESGLRHVYVASFSLSPRKKDSGIA
eukprot:TRINITY_DN22233_c0_g1_i1.p1 TRINITY_DN22233_c0_g1~~TRINITY_DN22233_c0_g1_i1.p1  ORF type:complete len:318 (-),score=51.70 TRINITY_DN22233_c0_g1_i1:223-1176(-)